MSQPGLQQTLAAFREYAAQQGWDISDEKPIQAGYQLRVSDGEQQVPVSIYTTGRVLVQGRASPLQEAVRSWWQSAQAGSQLASSADAAPLTSGLARVGMDEAGKGDYFGPLVVAAVYVEQSSERELLAAGVRDSKRLSDRQISALATRIRARCPHALVALGPERYNALYQEFANLNRMLAWGHARALENVLEQVQAPLAIADQFGDQAYLRQALLARGRSIELQQRPRAEADLAVAAASILARAEFVRRLEQLGREVGMPLPKGASDPAIVELGRAIVARGGLAALSRLVKLHFKTTRAILAADPGSL